MPPGSSTRAKSIEVTARAAVLWPPALLKSQPASVRTQGIQLLRRYFDASAAVARQQQNGLVLETPTLRANPD